MRKVFHRSRAVFPQTYTKGLDVFLQSQLSPSGGLHIECRFKALCVGFIFSDQKAEFNFFSMLIAFGERSMVPPHRLYIKDGCSKNDVICGQEGGVVT